MKGSAWFDNNHYIFITVIGFFIYRGSNWQKHLFLTNPHHRSVAGGCHVLLIITRHWLMGTKASYWFDRLDQGQGLKSDVISNYCYIMMQLWRPSLARLVIVCWLEAGGASVVTLTTLAIWSSLSPGHCPVVRIYLWQQKLVYCSQITAIMVAFASNRKLLITLFCSCAGFDTPLPYFYPLSLLFLLAHRASRDSRKCQQKFGAAWDRYCQRVKYRIVPYIYWVNFDVIGKKTCLSALLTKQCWYTKPCA